MATRKFRIKLDIDERTNSMSSQALLCRALGHTWTLRSQSPARFRELARMGMREFDRVCSNNCGSTWRQLWNVRERVMVENERRYPHGGEYLLPPGTGRLSRGEAITAQFARELATVS